MNCKICGVKTKSLHNHIQWQHKNYTTKKYYDEFIREEGEGICFCGKETHFRGLKHKYAKSCGYSCHHKNKFMFPGYMERHKKITSEITSKRNKQQWKDEKYRDKMLQVLKKSQNELSHLKINKSEIKLLKVLTDLDNTFEYVGDWKLFVAGKCPDFISEDRGLIVEFFGDYWHRNDTKKQIKKRINLFKKEGYETLVVWEYELKNTQKLENKLSKFITGENR